MKNAILSGSGLALLLRAVSAQSYDKTVCDEERFGEYTDPRVYLPNAWNDQKDKDGFVCMSVDNSTPAMDITWNWPSRINDVHSYPYVRLNADNLPTTLSGLRSIVLSTDWTITHGNPSSPPRTFSSSDFADQKEELEEEEVQCNAAWDFFLDEELENVYNPVNSSVEVMVWLGSVGNPQWLGYNDDPIGNITIGDVEFSVYYDTNKNRGQHVFTTVVANGSDVNSFEADFAPLFEYILENPADIDDFPEDLYLGIVEFGTETWYGDTNVTFTAANFAMDLDADGRSGDTASGGSSNSDDDDSAAGALGLKALGLVAPVALMMGAVFA